MQLTTSLISPNFFFPPFFFFSGSANIPNYIPRFAKQKFAQLRTGLWETSLTKIDEPDILVLPPLEAGGREGGRERERGKERETAKEGGRKGGRDNESAPVKGGNWVQLH